jgi:GDP-L-fucose synthase
MDRNARIFVAGHRGLAGSAIVRHLAAKGYGNQVLRTREELDLLDQAAVRRFFAEERPEYVFLAAAKVGGIHANHAYPADFLYENLAIECHVVRAAHDAGVKKLLFLGSTCIYPRDAAQPIREEALLTGPLETTNEAYAIAKIAGLEMCRAFRRQYGDRFISCMPTNLYGPGDNFHAQDAHVLPALLRRFHEATRASASEVVVWGSGTPLREFLHVDDMADACVFLMEQYDGERHVNVGTGEEISIRGLAEAIAGVTGFRGRISFDASKPDGTPRKVTDVARLHALGWKHRIGLEEGLRRTYEWYLSQPSHRGEG